jgi:hypothetical protein
MLLRLHLLLAGAAVCAVLAFNPAFVALWVGPEFFGGVVLHVLLAFGIVVSSLMHGLVTAAAVLGNRLRVGVLALLNGVLQIGCALLLGVLWGLVGIALAALVTGLVTTVPGGVRLLAPSAITLRSLVSRVVMPWLGRAAPLMGAAGVAGAVSRGLPWWSAAAATVALSAAYLWWMRPLYRELPLDTRWSRWLVSLRLLPEPTPPIGQV